MLWVRCDEISGWLSRDRGVLDQQLNRRLTREVELDISSRLWPMDERDDNFEGHYG